MPARANRLAGAKQHMMFGMIKRKRGSSASVPDDSLFRGTQRKRAPHEFVLEALEESHFLKRGHDGVFTRQGPDAVDR